jgi:thioesterase domain-containing protein
MSELVPDSMSAKGLEAFLHDKIPLTKAMGLHVAESNARRLVLEAPLDKNVNHLGTAFGGSLHALPTLACYAGLWTLMREAGVDGHVVVKRSQAFYRAPVTGRLRAVCVRPPAALAKEFIADLRRHGKARMDLTAVVEGAAGKPAVEFSGSFVALV